MMFDFRWKLRSGFFTPNPMLVATRLTGTTKSQSTFFFSSLNIALKGYSINFMCSVLIFPKKYFFRVLRKDFIDNANIFCELSGFSLTFGK